MHRARAATTAVAFGLAALTAGPVAAAEDDPTRAELERRLGRVENIIDSGQLAELIQKVSALEQEMRELRGEIESQAHRLDELRQRQRNLYADLDRRIRALEIASQQADEADDAARDSGAGAESASGGADGGGDGEDSAEPANGGNANAGESGASGASGGSANPAAGEAGNAGAGDNDAGDNDAGDADSAQQQADQGGKAEQKAYDAAFQLLKDGRYEKAASAFRKFIEKHPDGPYADNAQYWLGESRYVKRDFEAALTAFRGVEQQFPQSAKLPDARLKIGYTLYELGRLEKARSALQTVIDEHANSAVARLAEERLLKIKRAGQ